ncbi:MAG: pilus assembly protein PilP [Candidatus Accumulibacter sp.]|mgnify:CR=1 FL=1|uniref:pilus assembly protein PilP n=1 Tax=Accumulibacter sp. TaxID=2053492 RepID=UPI0019EE252D|nr:pilus assembly protein PilP [Accumulibacter sp.]MBE2260924.1 pilus assembly protein PilP [Paracoccaceae bacterium]MCB1941424.1 pilus assembly protein PilP [Accumulibacter sp.]MCP5249398.1 pilus assembly protein PilP [Accumulibacter sp.]
MSRVLALLISIGLVACSSGDHDDVREWMSTVAQDTKGKIPPLPVVEPYEPVAYDVGDLLDPFKPAKLGSDAKKGGGGFRPDLDRPKEPLELYPLESLKYVGVITRGKASYAIIQVDSALYQVKVGNYMGQNFGVVVGISESEVTLRELIQDSAGDWVERTSNLLLQEKGAK